MDEIGYGVVEQFGLVAALGEFDLRIYIAEICSGFFERLFQAVHVLIALFDDGECDSPLAVEQRVATGALHSQFHVAEIA